MPQPSETHPGSSWAVLRAKTISDLFGVLRRWCPVRPRLAGNIAEVKQAVAAAGRDPDAFTITAYGTKATAETIESLIPLPVDRIVFNLRQKSPAEVTDQIGELGRLIGTF